MDRDNHAGKIDSLSYIGGFFDGEGYIGLGSPQKSSNGGTNIGIHVRFSNTDIRPLEFIHQTLHSFGIKSWISTREGIRRSMKRTDGSPVKTIHDVGFAGRIQVKNFITLVRHYVFVRGEQMDVVMEFISSREKAMSGRGNRHGIGKAEYTEYEKSLIFKVRELKGTSDRRKSSKIIESKSSETIR